MRRAVIETERLILRPVAEDDEPAVLAALADIQVVRWLAVVPHPYRPEHFRAWLPTAKPGEVWAVEAPGGLIGVIGISAVEADDATPPVAASEADAPTADGAVAGGASGGVNAAQVDEAAPVLPGSAANAAIARAAAAQATGGVRLAVGDSAVEADRPAPAVAASDARATTASRAADQASGGVRGASGNSTVKTDEGAAPVPAPEAGDGTGSGAAVQASGSVRGASGNSGVEAEGAVPVVATKAAHAATASVAAAQASGSLGGGIGDSAVEADRAVPSVPSSSAPAATASVSAAAQATGGLGGASGNSGVQADRAVPSVPKSSAPAATASVSAAAEANGSLKAASVDSGVEPGQSAAMVPSPEAGDGTSSGTAAAQASGGLRGASGDSGVEADGAVPAVATKAAHAAAASVAAAAQARGGQAPGEEDRPPQSAFPDRREATSAAGWRVDTQRPFDAAHPSQDAATDASRGREDRDLAAPGRDDRAGSDKACLTAAPDDVSSAETVATRRGASGDAAPSATPPDPASGAAAPPPRAIRHELGYWFARSSWGRGYGREAVGAVLAAHFADPAAPDLHANVHDGNARSEAVLRRLGFTVTGHRRYHAEALRRDVDATTHRLGRADWIAANPLVIETPRLRLDPLGDADAPALRRLVSFPAVAWNLVDGPVAPSHAAALHAIAAARWQGEPPYRLAIRLRDETTLVGLVGLSAGDEPEVSFCIDPAQGRRGWLAEALEAFVDETRRRHAPPGLSARLFADDAAGARMLTALGFQRDEGEMVTTPARSQPSLVYRWRLARSGPM